MTANTLRIIKLDLHVRALSDYSTTGFLGNKLRGALGYALAKLYCNLKDDEDLCRCKPPCVYGNVFKPKIKHPEFTSVISPFSLSVSDFHNRDISEGEVGIFSIILYGGAIKYWKHMIEAAIYMFSHTDRAFNLVFGLESVVSALDGQVLWKDGEYYSSPNYALWNDEKYSKSINIDEQVTVYIEFLTPFITKEGIEVVDDFYKFIDYVFYRVASMIDIYDGGSFCVPYSYLFRKPKVESLLTEKGVIFRGKIARYLPYMALGADLHIGKKCTYGYGEYSMKVL